MTHADDSVDLPTLPNFGGMPVLLVEDNARLRGLMVTSLESLGCRVQAAGDAADALKQLRLAAEPPRLLISDVRMPGKMDGIALAEVASAKMPDLRVLLLTGYSAVAVNAFDLLNKPFTLEELAAAIQQVLLRAPSAARTDDRA